MLAKPSSLFLQPNSMTLLETHPRPFSHFLPSGNKTWRRNAKALAELPTCWHSHSPIVRLNLGRSEEESSQGAGLRVAKPLPHCSQPQLTGSLPPLKWPVPHPLQATQPLKGSTATSHNAGGGIFRFTGATVPTAHRPLPRIGHQTRKGPACPKALSPAADF